MRGFFALKILTIAVVSFLATFSAPETLQAQDIGLTTHPAIVVNGVQLPLDAPAELKRGNVFIPLGPVLFMSLSAGTDVNIASGGTVVRMDLLGHQLVFTEGNADFLMDGDTRKAADAPYLYSDGVLMVSAKDMFEALDATVEWNAARMKLIVTKEVAETRVSQVIPPEIFGAPSPGAPETATSTPETATSTVPAATETAAPGSMTEAELDAFLSQGKAIQISYDNVIALDADTVSGDRSQSYIIPNQTLQDRLSLRAEGKLKNGYQMKSSLNALSSTDRDSKKGEIEKANVSLEKGGMYYNLLDILPRFSMYSMKNYRLRGFEMKSTKKNSQFNLVSGKSPKKYKDSEYARYVTAARYVSGTDARHLAFNFVDTRDTGQALSTEALSNRMFSLEGRGLIKKNWDWYSELSHSSTDFRFSGKSAKGNALLFQSRRTSRTSTIDMGFEQTAADFISETAYFTQGKHEFYLLTNTALSKRLTFGAGHKNRLLAGNRTYIYPVMITYRPSNIRKDMTFDLRDSYERTTGANHSLTDNRRFTYKDAFGKGSLIATLYRNKNKGYTGLTALQFICDYLYQYQATEKDQLTFQFNRTRTQYAVTPASRYWRFKFARELGEWSDASVSFERYYDGTASDRYGYFAAYRILNVVNNTEITFEYSLLNYRYHNENSLKLRYNIYH